ncbi:MAG: sigma-70 family RNA polymerase sigma factor [Gemmatales bacterium]
MTGSARTVAWQSFYDAHAARLWRNIAQRIASSADVADVVQETLLAAAHSFAQYDATRGSAWNWLWGIGHRQVALYYRKRSAHPTSDGEAEGLAAWLESTEASPHEQAIRLEWGSLIRQALATLSAEYDALLTARYLEDRPVEELAREAGVNDVALRSRLARARTALREELLRRVPCLRGEQS